MARASSRIVLAVIGVAVAATVAVGVWKRAVRPNLFPKNFGVVEAGQVYRSGELSPEALRRVVTEHGIRTVIDLGAHDAGSADEAREQRTCQALGVDRFQFRLYGDATGNPNTYVQALRLMADPARRPVLVHCNAGSERTSCAVIMYRHIVQGRRVEDVYPESFAHRHSDERNPKLREMVDRWTAPVAEAYRTGSQIVDPEAPTLPEPVAVTGVERRQ